MTIQIYCENSETRELVIERMTTRLMTKVKDCYLDEHVDGRHVDSYVEYDFPEPKNATIIDMVDYQSKLTMCILDFHATPGITAIRFWKDQDA